MKILSNAIVLLFLCCFAKAAANEPLVKQLFISNQGKEYRHTFLYNASGRVQLETRHVLSNGAWQRESQTEWFYDGSNCVKQVQRMIENDSWRNTDEIVSDYNRLDELTDERVYRYVNGVQTPVRWTKFLYDGGVFVAREEYAYSNGKEQLALSNAFIYEGDRLAGQMTTAYQPGGAPKEVYSTVFDYTPGGAVKSMLLSRLVDGVYQNVDSITCFYDAAGRLVSQRAKTWSVKNEAWENARQTDYEYDEQSNLLSETYKCWGGMAWENVCRYQYLYEDGVQFRRSLQTQLYREWRNMMSVHYSEFVEGKARVIYSEYDFWGGDQGERVRSHIPFLFNGQLVIREAESIRLNYDDPSLVTNNSDQVYPPVHVYPNPSDGVFYLSTEKYEILSWSVYDMKGQLVKSHVQRYHTGVIDITGLEKGIYILRLETTAGSQQQKLVKM